MGSRGWRAPTLLIAAALIFGLFGSASASAAKKPPVKVSTGSYHTCAVDRQKHVQCWGDNTYGGTDSPGGKFKSVGAGYYSTCGLRTNQRIDCWGLDDSGEASPPGGRFKYLA
jgi:alpha-tubulin suppressor-like RCC1 family protein